MRNATTVVSPDRSAAGVLRGARPPSPDPHPVLGLAPVSYTHLDVYKRQAILHADGWEWRGERHPYPGRLKDRTIYHRDGDDFVPVSRFDGALIKLVPTEWGAPTFEIDGIKMLPSESASPLTDAQRKVCLLYTSRCV